MFQVVIPNRNQGMYVREAIRSVIAQGMELELVVVDGNSTDNSLVEIEAALAEGGPARCTVVSEPDTGQSDAINKGMRLGSGEIVSWLNSDDHLVEGALATVDSAFRGETDDVVAIYGDLRYIDEAGHVVLTWREQDFSRDDLLWGPGYIPQPSTFVRRRAWEAAGGLREDLHYAMDIDLWLRLSMLGRIVHVPEVLAEFRWHPRSKTVAGRRAMRREAMLIRREHASVALGRTPSRLEVEVRHLLVRGKRRLRFRREGLGRY
jgi:glycosyltransferase involved in cell wall biosynthesis